MTTIFDTFEESQREALFKVSFFWGHIFIKSTRRTILQDLMRSCDEMGDPLDYYNNIEMICWMSEIKFLEPGKDEEGVSV